MTAGLNRRILGCHILDGPESHYIKNDDIDKEDQNQNVIACGEAEVIETVEQDRCKDRQAEVPALVGLVSHLLIALGKPVMVAHVYAEDTVAGDGESSPHQGCAYTAFQNIENIFQGREA